jgi:tetratricopeptide (TPR) repeat protein
MSRAGENAFRRTAINGAMAALLVFYGVSTIARNVEMRDELTLHMREMIRSPENPRFHYNVALAYAKAAGENRETATMSNPYCAFAVAKFKESVSLNPRFQSAHTGLGCLYLAMGLYDLAIEANKKAIEVQGEDTALAYNNLGIAYSSKGMPDAAIRYYKMSLALQPEERDVYVNLGNAYFKKKEYAKAKRAWSRALALGASDRELREKIGVLEKEGY